MCNLPLLRSYRGESSELCDRLPQRHHGSTWAKAVCLRSTNGADTAYRWLGGRLPNQGSEPRKTGAGTSHRSVAVQRIPGEVMDITCISAQTASIPADVCLRFLSKAKQTNDTGTAWTRVSWARS